VCVCVCMCVCVYSVCLFVCLAEVVFNVLCFLVKHVLSLSLSSLFLISKHLLCVYCFYSPFVHTSSLVDKGGDWDRKNRLKSYEGLQAMRVRDFSKAAQLFFDTLATFTSYELFKYNDFVRYCVLMATLTLERPALKARV
jgi:proteasome regulatory subunit RPN7-like protein